MLVKNQQIEFRRPNILLPEGNFVCVNNEKVKDQASKSKRNRKLLLILLMLLIISQVIALQGNGVFINKSVEPDSVNEHAITLDDLKAVNDDLNEVRKSLNKINSNSELKDDHVEVKKVEVKAAEVKKLESKPAVVPVVPVVTKPAPVVVKKDKEKIKPKQKISENKKVELIEKSPLAVIPVLVSSDDETIPSVEKPADEVNIVVETKPAYIKHDIKGDTLEENKEKGACIQDTRTNLMCEVKSKESGMRNTNNLYSWYSPNNKSLKGVADGGRCKGEADCDTNAYIEAINQQGFCGHNDWRLPTRDEMMGLVSYADGSGKVTINTNYFPQALPSWYWTASSNKSRPEFAWYVLFKNGVPLNDLKENPKHIRLVRSFSPS